jgi:hypothetical protein
MNPFIKLKKRIKAIKIKKHINLSLFAAIKLIIKKTVERYYKQ